MIGKLTGKVDSIGVGSCIIDVSGVGYVVSCSANTLRHLSGKDDFVSLIIETHVREDQISLFGFWNEQERDMFRLLVKVNGVGVKVALAILGGLSAPQLASAITLQDKSVFQPISGIGPKLATRIVTELKDKFNGIDISHMSSGSDTASNTAINNDMSDAMLALINLGYHKDTVSNIVQKISKTSPDSKVGDIIRMGLKELSL